MATDVSQSEPEAEEPEAVESAEASPESPPPAPGRGAVALAALMDRASILATRENFKKAGIAAGALFFVAILAYWMTREEGKTNAELLQDGLTMLEEGRNAGAWKIARDLQQLGYQDPDFPGGDQFILGIVAFREANELSEEEGREQKYLVAKSFLEEAQKRAITAKWKPQWAYALGVSLHRIGRARAAQPFLSIAVESYPPGKIEGSLLLADTYLFTKKTEELKLAHKLTETLLAMPDLSSQHRDRAYIQQAQILYALGKAAEAEVALAQVKTVTHAITILRAEVMMYENKYKKALEKLRPVEQDDGLKKKYPRQARYLMGVCEQKLAELASSPEMQTGHLDAARNYYERTFKQFYGSHEGLAAQLWAADVLRKQDFHEKALETYNDTLRQVHDPREFSNKWIDIKIFQKVILEAWNTWNSLHLYQHSIALTDHMSPLFPPALSSEYKALACQKSAEFLEEELKSNTYAVQSQRKAELGNRWIRSGQAYSVLAQNRKTTAAYPDDLWISAEHFMNGHDYTRADSQLKKFLNTNPTKRLPMALVRKGRVLMNLNDFENALKHLERVLERHSTSQVAFQTQYLIGKCYYETNQLDKAEQAWREMLISTDLTPAASEWQNALFGLGKLLHQSAVEQAMQAAETMKTDQTAGLKLKRESYRRWDKAIVRLEEYLNRYDNDSNPLGSSFESKQEKRQLIEARYYLAKACQRSAELSQEKLRTAETDNARAEYRAQMKQLLDQSNENFLRLKMDLLQFSDQNQIDELGVELLRNCYFEIPDNYFTIEDYNGAFLHYREAAGRYQSHPDALRAMVQEANCYDRLGRKGDMRGALAQAKFILEQIPEAEFEKQGEAMSKEQWRSWLDWAIEHHNQDTLSGLEKQG